MIQFFDIRSHVAEPPAWVGNVFFWMFVGSLIGLILTWLFNRRNNRVGAFRMTIVAMVATAAAVDVERGLNATWRFQAYDAVTYDQMLFKFWRRLRIDQFYSDLSFIRPPNDD